MVAEPGSDRRNWVPAVLLHLPLIVVLVVLWLWDMTTPIIDTRLLGKPPKFEGDITHWKQWKFQTLAYFGALDPGAPRGLEVGRDDSRQHRVR